jgi:hypothetical protein
VPASMHGEMQPTIYRFWLGGFEIATIMDSKAVRDGLYPSFGSGQPADEVRELARANHVCGLEKTGDSCLCLA